MIKSGLRKSWLRFFVECWSVQLHFMMLTVSPQINWSQPALVLHNFIRGNDKLPGAWTIISGQVSLHLAKFLTFFAHRFSKLFENMSQHTYTRKDCYRL